MFDVAQQDLYPGHVMCAVELPLAMFSIFCAPSG
jgi:hypothetical protein